MPTITNQKNKPENTEAPFILGADVHEANMGTKLPNTWTGVARSDNNGIATYFYLGIEGTERTWNVLLGVINYAEALDEAKRKFLEPDALTITTGDITLSNGTVITHKPNDNGSRTAFVKDSDRSMTPPEWDEYCQQLKNKSLSTRWNISGAKEPHEMNKQEWQHYAIIKEIERAERLIAEYPNSAYNHRPANYRIDKYGIKNIKEDSAAEKFISLAEIALTEIRHTGEVSIATREQLQKRTPIDIALDDNRKFHITQALYAGKTVPEEVLADFPLSDVMPHFKNKPQPIAHIPQLQAYESAIDILKSGQMPEIELDLDGRFFKLIHKERTIASWDKTSGITQSKLLPILEANLQSSIDRFNSLDLANATPGSAISAPIIGKVIDVSADYIVQDIGKNKRVYHAITNLDIAPVPGRGTQLCIGDRLEIKYTDNGKAKVTNLDQQLLKKLDNAHSL